ncbi:MAG TPA: hypothetical protein VEB21_19605 [Terriglobales bacterium]|nr:hypothetical protein [Terriglobales bacterium]
MGAVMPKVVAATRAPVPVTDNDRYFDYCLQPYDPIRDPRGKLRSESLLWNSLDVVAAPTELDAVLRAVQLAAGRDMTVVGIKHQAGRLWWELYFYDRQKDDPSVRAAGIAAACAPWVHIAPLPSESIPYFMFSFDVLPDTVERGRVDLVNLYLPYYEVQGGRSYKLSARGLEMDNVYRFLHPKMEIREILHEIRQSVFVDYGRVSLARVLLPELIDCNRICVAKKRYADAVYYSGIDVGQLLFFLRTFDYPRPIVSFVETHRGRLDHLRFDVGIDYTMNPDGSLAMTKSSYYATL